MSRSPDPRGFTLLEVVASLAVVGLVFAGALGVAAADLRASRKTVAVAEASALADDLLLRIQFPDPDSAVALGARDNGRFPSPLDRYHWRLSSLSVPGEPDLLEAIVTIAWDGGSIAVATRFASPMVSTEAR